MQHLGKLSTQVLLLILTSPGLHPAWLWSLYELRSSCRDYLGPYSGRQSSCLLHSYFSIHLLLLEGSTHAHSCCVSPEVSPALPWDGKVVPLQNIPAKPGNRQCHRGHLCLFAGKSGAAQGRNNCLRPGHLFGETIQAQRIPTPPNALGEPERVTHHKARHGQHTGVLQPAVLWATHNVTITGWCGDGKLEGKETLHHRHKKTKVSRLKKGQGLLDTIYFPKGVEREKEKRAESPEGALIK